MTNHKSRNWRDIDKHPLPCSRCMIDVKMECGSILIGCNLYIERARRLIMFKGGLFDTMGITQWRDAK